MSLDNASLAIPSEDDYNGAVQAIIRLQVTYQLPTYQLAQGRVLGRGTRQGLTPRDLLAVGRGYLDRDRAMAGEWLDQALASLDEGTEHDKRAPVQYILNLTQANTQQVWTQSDMFYIYFICVYCFFVSLLVSFLLSYLILFVFSFPIVSLFFPCFSSSF